MRRSTIVWVTALAFAAVGQANAADMSRPSEGGYKDGPAYAGANWSGFYIGANGGYAWSASTDQLAQTRAVVPFKGFSSDGGFGGGQIGYNMQGAFGLGSPWVLGVEADLQGASIGNSRLGDTNVGSPYKNKFSSQIDYFGTIRARVGYAFATSLIYFTGGFAYGGIHNEVDFDSNNPTPGYFDPFSKNGTATGYVLGGGYEYKFNSSWSAKLEYQFIDLGKNVPVGVSPSPFVGQPVDGNKIDSDAFHTVRAGINYHVGSTYEPLK